MFFFLFYFAPFSKSDCPLSSTSSLTVRTEGEWPVLEMDTAIIMWDRCYNKIKLVTCTACLSNFSGIVLSFFYYKSRPIATVFEFNSFWEVFCWERSPLIQGNQTILMICEPPKLRNMKSGWIRYMFSLSHLQVEV